MIGRLRTQQVADARSARYAIRRSQGTLDMMSISIEDLYPDATAEERAEAEYRLDAYLRLVIRIADRLAADPVDEQEKDPYDERVGC